MKGGGTISATTVRILDEILNDKFKGNVSAFAAELSKRGGSDVSRQRLQYLLDLKADKDSRVFSLLDILIRCRKILGQNWAVFGSKLESEVTKGGS